jgi:hypothetical protein
MFIGATSFDQPRLYCNWKDKVQTQWHANLRTAFCGEEDFGGTCDLLNEDDCYTPPSPTPPPRPNANVGGGKTAHFACTRSCFHSELICYDIFLNHTCALLSFLFILCC